MHAAGCRFPDLCCAGSGSRRVRTHGTGAGGRRNPLRRLHAAGRGLHTSPLRTLLESFGDWDVWWDAQSEAAKAATDGFHITADPAEGTITVNGITYLGIVYVQNGRTYVPLRLLVTQLGGGVAWDPYLGGAAVSSPEAEYDAADLYWLSRIISAESQGESLKGQIAVGNVVLNRVEADDFPDTIPAVIFDRKNGTQFQPVDNGTVYQPPTALSVEAARAGPGRRGGSGGCSVFLRTGPVSGDLDQLQPDLPHHHRLPPVLPLRDRGLTFAEMGHTINVS